MTIKNDYGGGFYPSGLVGNQILYFNEEDVDRVLFEGYVDEDDMLIQEKINEWFVVNDLKRGSVEEINKIRKRQMMEAAERANNVPKPSKLFGKKRSDFVVRNTDCICDGIRD